MLENLIVQQDAFLKDYKKAINQSSESDEEIIQRVLRHLNLTGDTHFSLSAQETKNQKPVDFPFERQLRTEEYDGALETEYTYVGKPFETNDDTDEQQEW